MDTSNLTLLEKAIKPETKAIFVESPTNPLMKLTDLGAVAKLGKSHGLLTVVDNTFFTPYLQRPLEDGIDIVIHSATKYLGGHSDVVGGLVVVNRQDLSERLQFLQNSVGAILGPQDSWLLIRGIKTLSVRLEKSQENAFRVVDYLKRHPKVHKIYYPGKGSMISFELISAEAASTLLNQVKMLALAESLGGVESLISLPAAMTHASIPKEKREILGIRDSLVRLSVGIEAFEDIIADLDRGLS